MSKKKIVESLAVTEEPVVVKKKSKQSPTRSRKKAVPDTPEENSELSVKSDVTEVVVNTPSASSDASKKTPRRTRRKAASSSTGIVEERIEKKVRTRRKTTKKVDNIEDQGGETDLSDHEGSTFTAKVEDEEEEDLDLGKDDEDISSTYGWPPLVCCFGAAQHAFVPSGRPANRLIDYEIHERMKDTFWNPEKFVRAPGGSAGSVAVALASLGGKVAFMGKLGDDDFGQTMLYYMNVSNVQTRSVCIDGKKATAVSQMKIGRRGGLKMTCVKPCAEDSLSRSEINIDVLREAKMFYFNTSSLLDQNMASTTFRAIKISKKLGGVIFYDLNLPLPLWQSGQETKNFIQQAWNLADIIEVTKQELEFICGIKSTENFDTKDNNNSKFVHYDPVVVGPLWHENLKVLFVTNGTSKIHFYTKEENGAVHGMEDAPITPFTCDMSASGDGIVAGLMRMLTVQPHLITDKGYLEHSIRYAIDCGVIDQWLLARQRGYPPKEDVEEEVVPDQDGIRSITEKEYRTLASVS